MYLNLDSRLSLLIFLPLIAARFLSLYASDLPQPVVRRIWDSALTNGKSDMSLGCAVCCCVVLCPFGAL